MDDKSIAYVHAYRIKKKLDLKIRKKVYKRANYRCEDCNRDLCCPTCLKPLNSRILRLHHEDGDSNNNELTNLLLLCKNCRMLRRQERRDKEFFIRLARNGANRNSNLKKIEEEIEKLAKLHRLISQRGRDSDLVKNLLKEEKRFFKYYRSPSPIYQLWLSLNGQSSIKQ